MLVLVEWRLVRFHVKVRLLERALPGKVYLVDREETTSLSPCGIGLHQKELETWRIREKTYPVVTQASCTHC